MTELYIKLLAIIVPKCNISWNDKYIKLALKYEIIEVYCDNTATPYCNLLPPLSLRLQHVKDKLKLETTSKDDINNWVNSEDSFDT